jgi:hypothetical protein
MTWRKEYTKENEEKNEKHTVEGLLGFYPAIRHWFCLESDPNHGFKSWLTWFSALTKTVNIF